MRDESKPKPVKAGLQDPMERLADAMWDLGVATGCLSPGDTSEDPVLKEMVSAMEKARSDLHTYLNENYEWK